MEDHEPVLGIDLGTTNSCVGVWDWKQETVRIIATDEGDRTIPSVVCFNKGDVLVGAAAKRKLTVSPKNTIYNSKRVIGRPFSKLRKEDIARWTFDMEGGEGRPRYKVAVEGEEKLVSPEEIGALILLHLKGLAERAIGTEITKVVITVPAYFTEPQRRATRDAGMLAGLDVIRLLPEPTAAALAFGLDRKSPQGPSTSYVLVFDMGGGTFDVSILALDGKGSFVTKAVTGDFHLGGEDFDDLLLEWVLAQPGMLPHAAHISAKQRQKLRKLCETAKCELSNSNETTIEVDIGGEEVSLDISRAMFNKLCSELFENAMGEVADALELAGITETDISNIVLVGGSTRIPKLQEMLKARFKGKRLWCGVNPDEAVAWGATALAASVVSGRKQTSGGTAPAQHAGAAIPLRNLDLESVTPITLGIELSDGTMDVLVPRGSKIPTSRSDNYTTAIASQKSVVIQVYEGECTSKATDNYLLGKFTMPVEDAAAGVPMIKVTFEITADGLFLVTARDMKNKKEITVKLENSNLTGDEKDNIVAAVGTERGRLRAYISQVYGKAAADGKDEVTSACRRLLEWLHSYPEASKAEIISNHEKLEALAREAGVE
eukprot:TRINITY_DN13960_c0_g1_i2.p1 TRINITY_DN13960_c0_g1~~TRINITY_DN13960_c0_g1_i2.p1  ORF type:complete len:604 (+),score=200.95 TRINITY_DN13960_c0_g1_i2:266-2077(+)